MSYCPNCGNYLSEDDRFCGKCGTSFENSPEIPNSNNTSIFRRPWFWLVIVIAGVFFALYQLGVIGQDKTTYLVAANSKVVFLKPGGETDITIDTDGKHWKITHSPDWCAVDKSESGVLIKCGKKHSSENREGRIQCNTCNGTGIK